MQCKYDSVSQCAIKLTSDWLQNMKDDYKEEDDPVWPLLLLEGKSRRSIFDICYNIGARACGIPGLACRLTERYLLEVMKSGIQSQWQSRKIKLSIILVVCVQLAVKIKSQNMPNYKPLLKLIQERGYPWTSKDINAEEFQVFRRLGFRIPLWTSVEQAEAVAVHIGLPPEMVRYVTKMMSFAEYIRDSLNRLILPVARKCKTCSKYSLPPLRTVHLVAGCVLATVLHTGYPGHFSTQELAQTVLAPACYIDHISTNILNHLSSYDTRSNALSLVEEYNEVKLLKQRR